MNRLIIYTVAVVCLLVAKDGTDLSAQPNRSGHHQQTKKPVRKSASVAFPGQFSESSERLLTEKDIEHQTAWGMKVMMNEIYARQGFIFRDADLKKHFAKEKWYKRKERNINKIKLSPTEVQNIAFIKQHQPNAKR